MERARDDAARAENLPVYHLRAAVFGEADAATQQLTTLIDAGFDGTLMSQEVGGNVLFEIRIGPFDTIEEAERASALLRRTQGLAPTVVVETPQPEVE
jgi:hypothetical protein